MSRTHIETLSGEALISDFQNLALLQQARDKQHSAEHKAVGRFTDFMLELKGESEVLPAPEDIDPSQLQTLGELALQKHIQEEQTLEQNNGVLRARDSLRRNISDNYGGKRVSVESLEEGDWPIDIIGVDRYNPQGFIINSVDSIRGKIRRLGMHGVDKLVVGPPSIHEYYAVDVVDKNAQPLVDIKFIG